MQLDTREIWFGLARAISSADGQFTEPEYLAAFRAGEKLLNIPATQERSPWENTSARHEDIAASFLSLCTEDRETAIQILVGLVYIAQADGEASQKEAELMWQLFHAAGLTEEQVEGVCDRAKDLHTEEE